MREVAVNPLHGVYTSREAVGREGHFVTSPEISQMFGESLAIWFLNEWMKMGEPGRFQLVELGPGKGTLMADTLATLARLQPGIVRGISVHLVEVSPRMKKQQEVDLAHALPWLRRGPDQWRTAKRLAMRPGCGIT